MRDFLVCTDGEGWPRAGTSVTVRPGDVQVNGMNVRCVRVAARRCRTLSGAEPVDPGRGPPQLGVRPAAMCDADQGQAQHGGPVTATAGVARSATAPESRKAAAVTVEKPAPASPLTRPRIAGGETRFTVVISGTMNPCAMPDANHSTSTTCQGGARLVASRGRQVITASGMIERTWRMGSSRPTSQAPMAAPAGRLAIRAAPTTGSAPSSRAYASATASGATRNTAALQPSSTRARSEGSSNTSRQPARKSAISVVCSPTPRLAGRHRRDTASTVADTRKLTTSSIRPARSPTSTITTPAATMPTTWSTW